MNAISDSVLTFERLSAIARTVDPSRLRAAICEFRQGVSGPAQQACELFPSALADMLAIAAALATLAVEDLGGAAWIERISPGLAGAEARHQAAAGG